MIDKNDFIKFVREKIKECESEYKKQHHNTSLEAIQYFNQIRKLDHALDVYSDFLDYLDGGIN